MKFKKMNVINVKIDFTKGICEKTGLSLITGDYNTTKVVFEFAEGFEGTKIFEMKNPSGNLVYADEIVNNEVILVGVDDNEEIYSLFTEEGDYIFEVSLYGENSKITSVHGYITANKEQVIVDGEVVEEKITLFDNLMNTLDKKIDETNNLNITANKVDTTTTITITKKDGTQQEVEILDGEDGSTIDNIEISNRDLLITYGGETSNLGQVAPNIQVGTTTTGSPSTAATVVNVGTDLNPILNFTIPKGEAGSISFEIVNELPEIGDEGIIYLLPDEQAETGNMYNEYIYINNTWEMLGSVPIEVDLTGYVKNTDYATGGTAGVVKIAYSEGSDVSSVGYLRGIARTYDDYPNLNNTYIISKGTLENAITGKDLTTKAYVDGLVGDIETILETLDVGSGV